MRHCDGESPSRKSFNSLSLKDLLSPLPERGELQMATTLLGYVKI
jgi:hypothetical protein